jgi:hypothetical protein
MVIKGKNRVFRIRQWKFDYNFRTWRPSTKISLLFDDEKVFIKKMTQLCRICDHKNKDTNISIGLVGEELIDGEWETFSYHPDNFDYEKLVK